MSSPTTRLTTTPSGLPEIGELPWGTQVCQLFSEPRDLLEILVPYFAAGLARNERCLWVTADPLPKGEARAALSEVVPDLEARARSGQIEIFDHQEWCLHTGHLTPDETVEIWLEREAEALANGHSGLRVSGNTSFLEPRQRESFADYEARGHRAFDGRRIVALCSYHLERCDSDMLLDVLRTHHSALVRQEGGWELVRSATLLLVANGEGRTPHREASRLGEAHTVCFHDGCLATGRITPFLAQALHAGRGAVVIATPETRAVVSEALAQTGLELAPLESEGRLIFLDAAETLEVLCVDGSPSMERVRRHIEPILAQQARDFGGSHLYGEMVDLLAADDRIAAALALEDCWNELLPAYPARLLCGYHLASFDTDADSKGFREVCESHGGVLPSKEAGNARRSLSSDQLVVELGQKNRIAHRAVDQLARLQSVTAALSEAVTTSEITRSLEGVLARAVGASQTDLAVVFGEQGAGRKQHTGERKGPISPLLRESHEEQGSWWLRNRGEIEERCGADCLPDAEALAVLPVSTIGRRLGAVAFAFPKSQPFFTAQRALCEDVARQLAIALDRARLFEEARQAREEAERVNRAKDDFLAMLGHELRNPLSPIVTTLHLMKLRDPGSLERERGILERQTLHLQRLVDDLLDVSRITRGKIRLEKRPVEIAEIVAQALETAAPLLEQKSHRLRIAVPPHGLVVHGDPARLAQLVANLLSNAAKYTPSEGSVEIQAREEEGQAVITVRDNGVGIPRHLLPSIFDSFVQGPRSRDRSEGGLGLGLSIVKTLVELHGGSVGAQSDGAGGGAELTVRLPLAPAWSTEATARSSAARTQPEPRSLRVLVVDDNADTAHTLAELLEVLGCQVATAHDGAAALTVAQEHRPELVLLDIGLPVMDGYQVARRLRELPGGADLRLVAVTGYSQQVDRELSKRSGFDQHCVKPMGFEQLQGLLSTARKEGREPKEVGAALPLPKVESRAEDARETQEPAAT